MKGLIFISIIILNSCVGFKKNEKILFKLEQTNSEYFGYKSTTYSIIDFNRLNNFKIIKDSTFLPNFNYNLAYNEGYMLSSAFTDIYTLGCCEYNKIEKAIDKHINNSIPIELLKKYENVNNISIKSIEKTKGSIFLYRQKKNNYKFTVWIVDVDYCICDLYMESPNQEYTTKAIYLKSINKIEKLNKNNMKKIKTFLDSFMDY